MFLGRWWQKWLDRWHVRSGDSQEPENSRRGRLGERAARTHLRRAGLKCLAVNFRSRRGELDLVCRDQDCLVFVEVKTRSREDWARPASAVDRRKRRALSRAARDYLRLLKQPHVKFRFDIVEVLLTDDRVSEVRHLPNAFPFVARDFFQ